MSEMLMCCPLCGAPFKMGREPDDNGYVAGMFYLFHANGPKGCRLGMGGHFDTEAQAVTAWNTRSEGLQPPVGVEGEVFSSLGASKAPSCGSPTDRQTSAVLVPREPTEAMLRAYKGALKALIESEPSPSTRWGKGTVRGYAISEVEKCRARWAAMIDAAPPTDRQTSGGEA